MPVNEFDHAREVETHDSPKSHTAIFVVITVGLLIALGGDGYLLVRSNQLDQQISQSQSGTQTQISKLNEATTTLLEQEQQRLEGLAQEMKSAKDTAGSAIKRARMEARKQGDELSNKFAEQQQHVASEMTQLQDTTTSKFAAVSTDVDGVKANVETVKANVASTQSDVEKTGADLKRVIGDMGVMSGFIATNSKDLQALRALGERNYFEFDLSKADGTKKIGDVMLVLKRSDPKHSRYTVDVLADDVHVEKKDKTINEPVQLYVSGNMQPYEIVVNQVKKDQVIGYLATPKVKVARR